jgi:hypothetical protein
MMKESQAGGDRLPQFRMQSECALTYMNAVSRKNLTGALAVDESLSRTGGALGDGIDRARFRRTTATCIWGVSDPLPTGPGPDRGGGRGGRSRPDDSVTAADRRADGTGGRQRRPMDGGEVADHRHFTH